MYKKIIVTLVLSLGLASVIYAMPPKSETNMSKQNANKSICLNKIKGSMFSNKHKTMIKNHYGMKHKSSMNILRYFKKLDLTNKQKEEIKTIVQNSFKKQKKINTVFTKTSFNKDEFIKQAMNKKENMIKSRANTIEKAYDVLSKKQKEQFKVLLDLNI